MEKQEYNPKEIVISLQEKDIFSFIISPWMNKNIDDIDCCKRGDMPLDGTTFIIERRSDLLFVRKILSALGYKTNMPCVHNSEQECRDEEYQLTTNYPFSRVCVEGAYTILEKDTPTFNVPKQTDLDLKMDSINEALDDLDERINELDDIISAPNGPRANRLADQLPLLQDNEQILPPEGSEPLGLELEF